MSLILALEPDTRQAALVRRVVRERIGGECVLVDSTDAAIATIEERIPDLMLLSALLSPRDEEQIFHYLRRLSGAEHLQTLTIPQLAVRPPAEGRGTRRLFGRKSRRPQAGCDPDVFADQIREYVTRALELKAERESAAAPSEAPEHHLDQFERSTGHQHDGAASDAAPPEWPPAAVSDPDLVTLLPEQVIEDAHPLAASPDLLTFDVQGEIVRDQATESPAAEHLSGELGESAEPLLEAPAIGMAIEVASVPQIAAQEEEPLPLILESVERAAPALAVDESEPTVSDRPDGTGTASLDATAWLLSTIEALRHELEESRQAKESSRADDETLQPPVHSTAPEQTRPPMSAAEPQPVPFLTLPPLSSGAALSADPSPDPDLQDLLSALALPLTVAFISRPRTCRIGRVRIPPRHRSQTVRRGTGRAPIISRQGQK